MNRILEAFEGDSQFTRSRLIDEDETLQNDLKTMKVSSLIFQVGPSLGSLIDRESTSEFNHYF